MGEQDCVDYCFFLKETCGCGWWKHWTSSHFPFAPWPAPGLIVLLHLCAEAGKLVLLLSKPFFLFLCLSDVFWVASSAAQRGLRHSHWVKNLNPKCTKQYRFKAASGIRTSS